jgi:hypothetical protein
MANNKITKTQEYAIMWLKHLKHNNESIAKELKISKDNIDKLTLDKTEESEITISNKSNMITHTAGKKINSVAIMTQTASEKSDQTLKNMQSLDRPTQKGIFRPKA